MKAENNVDLKKLIERLEHRQHVRKTATTTMAALGLIGFGVMMVPILGQNPPLYKIAELQEQPSKALPSPYASVSLIGQAAVVYDLTTGRALFEKNSDTQLPLASLTKLLTTYAAVTTLDRDASITVTPSALSAEGDSGLAAGQTFALRDLARFALVASSNDAAEAIAETAAKKRSTSDKSLLASAAAAAGLSQTYALNGTGLDENATVSGGYGSAHDVAVLAGALLREAPSIAKATIEPSVSITDYQGTVHSQRNTNQGIVHLPNPLLSKTGYTDLAGGNLVVVFDAGINHPIAVVVLGSTREGRFSDVDSLVSATLSHFAQDTD